MRACAFLMVLVSLVQCNPLKTSFDYDLLSDFSKYHTWNFSPAASEYGRMVNGQTLLTAIEREMQKRGFAKSDDPDVLIDIFVKLDENEKTIVTSSGGSPWSTGYSSGFKVTEVSSEQYQVGSVVLSMLDEQQKKVVWQGRAQKALRNDSSSDGRRKRINKAVEEIFKTYPFRYN